MLKKRSKPIQRHTGLRKSTSPPNKISDKRAERLKVYNPDRDKFLLDRPECEIKVEGCTFRSTEPHHTEGKENEKVLNLEDCLAACRNCHEWCDDHPLEAIEMGFSKRRNGPIG